MSLPTDNELLLAALVGSVILCILSFLWLLAFRGQGASMTRVGNSSPLVLGAGLLLITFMVGIVLGSSDDPPADGRQVLMRYIPEAITPSCRHLNDTGDPLSAAALTCTTARARVDYYMFRAEAELIERHSEWASSLQGRPSASACGRSQGVFRGTWNLGSGSPVGHILCFQRGEIYSIVWTHDALRVEGVLFASTPKAAYGAWVRAGPFSTH